MDGNSETKANLISIKSKAIAEKDEQAIRKVTIKLPKAMASAVENAALRGRFFMVISYRTATGNLQHRDAITCVEKVTEELTDRLLEEE